MNGLEPEQFTRDERKKIMKQLYPWTRKSLQKI